MKHMIAGIQMTSTFNMNENLEMAKELIQQAVDQGAELVVLPENFSMMGVDQWDTLKYREELDNGPVQTFLSDQAAKHHIWLVGGTLPIAQPDSKRARSACLVFNAQGKRVARYDKIHLFDVKLNQAQEAYSESNTIEPGDHIVVIDTPFGKLGLSICYDLRFPELFRQMHQQGVEIVVLPSAFTYTTGAAHWEILIRARAIENLIYIVAPNQTGTHPNKRKTFGHSMIVNPWGEIKALLPQEMGVVIAEIHLDYLHHVRKDFPALEHRRV